MDPPGIAALRRRARFPRPRGDGPSKDGSRTYANVVSPPTRGWTRDIAFPLDHQFGFPAHAGMDPADCVPTYHAHRFPRPRGDGPTDFLLKLFHQLVSPPTRGWTRVPALEVRPCTGFPAHAGMDPRPRTCPPGGIRFPRPRGDGPPGAFAGLTDIEVSPPTRGWTRRSDRAAALQIGFPAHAGMDPFAATAAVCPLGFPRPRGDGPLRGFKVFSLPLVSPPTRGWTRGQVEASNTSPGFPAHAGMDP